MGFQKFQQTSSNFPTLETLGGIWIQNQLKDKIIKVGFVYQKSLKNVFLLKTDLWITCFKRQTSNIQAPYFWGNYAKPVVKLIDNSSKKSFALGNHRMCSYCSLDVWRKQMVLRGQLHRVVHTTCDFSTIVSTTIPISIMPPFISRSPPHQNVFFIQYLFPICSFPLLTSHRCCFIPSLILFVTIVYCLDTGWCWRYE